MTDILTVVAWVRAASGSEDAVREALLSIVPPTREEEGCIEYNLHAVNDDPGLFYFVEQWRSGEDLDIHLASAHVRESIDAVEGRIEQIDIKRMTRIA
jgi:quinol monooxygenase YgiN